MNNYICTGIVRHRRYRDRQHNFRYKVLMFHLDLDNVDEIFNDAKLFAYNKSNLVAFKDKNYLNKNYKDCKHKVLELLAEKGLNSNIDKLYLLTNLEYLGYCFNPISMYFCISEGKIKYLILEVTNTPWGKRHNYVLEPQEVKNNIYKAEFIKELHVSPFLPMEYIYKINCKYTAEKIIVHLENHIDNKIEFDATLNLNMLPINNKTLYKYLFARFPATIKVICAIYWEATKLWLKGIKYITPRDKQ